MPDAYDREAFFRTFNNRMNARAAAERERADRHRAQMSRVRQGAPSTPILPVVNAPLPPLTAADLEFEKVRADALARIAAGEKAAAEAAAVRVAKRREEDAAVAAILGAFHSTSARQGGPQ